MKNCDLRMLSKILYLQLLCSEIDIFEVCIDWAKAKSHNATNLRYTLGYCVHKIRFCSMTFEEFANIVNEYPDLFSSHEIKDIFMEISKENSSNQELPSGYYSVNKILNKRKGKNGKVVLPININ